MYHNTYNLFQTSFIILLLQGHYFCIIILVFHYAIQYHCRAIIFCHYMWILLGNLVSLQCHYTVIIGSLYLHCRIIILCHYIWIPIGILVILQGHYTVIVGSLFLVIILGFCCVIQCHCRVIILSLQGHNIMSLYLDSAI